MGKRIAIIVCAVLLLISWIMGGGRVVPTEAQVLLPDEKEKYVAITFDDGPYAHSTERLLDGLRDRGVRATFFLIGQQIEGNEDLVVRMQAEGHQVGNHSWSHKCLEQEPDESLLREIEETDEALREVLGDGDYWVRPPYGLLALKQRALIEVPLIKWSVDPEDWKWRDAEKDAEGVLQAAQPGDIILLHDSLEPSVDAALRVIDTLQAEGYTFVTVRELLMRSGITPELGVLYCSTKRCE